jgi:hypothetical protein
VADTVCMPPLVVGILALLSSDIEGAASRLTVMGWRRREAPLLHRTIRRWAFQEYGGHQTGTESGSCVLAITSATQTFIAAATGQRALTEPDWSNLRPLRMRIPTKRYRPAGVHVRPAEA